MTTAGECAHSEVWLEVVGAVDYLAEGHRLGITVWDALEEALRWWTAELLDPREGFPSGRGVDVPWCDPDPLRSSMSQLLVVVPPAHAPGTAALGDVLTAALRAWLSVMAVEFNDSHRFAPALADVDPLA
jgi:hypothetical protein